jgi:hypothetical protein
MAMGEEVPVAKRARMEAKDRDLDASADLKQIVGIVANSVPGAGPEIG